LIHGEIVPKEPKLKFVNMPHFMSHIKGISLLPEKYYFELEDKDILYDLESYNLWRNKMIEHNENVKKENSPPIYNLKKKNIIVIRIL